MLYPLSYRRAGQARNVVRNPSAISTGTADRGLAGPVLRRSGPCGLIGAGSAYRCRDSEWADSPSRGLVSSSFSSGASGGGSECLDALPLAVMRVGHGVVRHGEGA